MSHYTELSGVRVLEGKITIPGWGAWHADVLLEREAALAPIGLVLVLADLEMVCSPWRKPIAYQGHTRVRLIGGYGGWGKKLAAKPYRSPTGVRLSLVLGDAAREAGEKIAIGTDRRIGVHYVRDEAPASRHLNFLCPSAWWIDADGTTRTGERPTSKIPGPITLLDYNGARGVATVAHDKPGELVPGRTFNAITIKATLPIRGVTHIITKGALRSEVLAA